jgi:hypothetical protein
MSTALTVVVGCADCELPHQQSAACSLHQQSSTVNVSVLGDCVTPDRCCQLRCISEHSVFRSAVTRVLAGHGRRRVHIELESRCAAGMRWLCVSVL